MFLFTNTPIKIRGCRFLNTIYDLNISQKNNKKSDRPCSFAKNQNAKKNVNFVFFKLSNLKRYILRQYNTTKNH